MTDGREPRRPGRLLRVGWVIADQLERSWAVRRGYLTGGGVGLARYAWLAARVNRTPALGIRHEIYRPWRRPDLVLFLKSMGPRSLALLAASRRGGRPTVFDANVNYYERAGREHYAGMLPTPAQQADALAITRAADAVIADSELLLDRVRPHNSRAAWIPDNVETALVPASPPDAAAPRPLRLLWSGEAVKLFELLAIEDVLVKYAPHAELVVITNALTALRRWPADAAARFRRLLDRVPHRILPYAGIPSLFDVYVQGGVFVAPRFLDNSYNLGHTEWKITLAMACGRLTLCSPVPSYCTVAERAGHRGIRICARDEDWAASLDAILAGQVDLGAEAEAARAVVAGHYATEVVARAHAAFLHAVAAEGPRAA
jgi:hypothetical protein